MTEQMKPEELRVVRGARTAQVIIVSVDSTRNGPALGGCRIKTYPTWRDGLDDAVRLSAAMTEKAALAQLPYGGGKTVVALDPDFTDARRPDLLADISEVLLGFGGSYITGPDVGSSPEDMIAIGGGTPWALCRPEAAGGSGDSSGPTAAGVIASIEAVRRQVFGGQPLSFSLIGLGHVGTLIGDHLAQTGARLIVSDLNPARKALTDRWSATWAEPGEALRADVDVVVPAAVGGILTPEVVETLRCRAIVGPANNQLDHDSTADRLHGRGICWAPDVVVSAGGIISAVARELQHAPAEEAERQVRRIGDRLGEILASARIRDVAPLTEARRRLAPFE